MSGKTEYENALKLGERCFRKELSKGNYPYLPALDSFLRASEVKSEESLGIVDIPLDQIVGTKTAGRSNAFASNFMPLVAEKSEFAGKWAGVFDHQENEGINDPIICYEYMNRFYVQEGNKRVSVMKYLGATSIEGRVTRLIPHHTNSTENRIFYEFIDFYDHTQINYLWFSGEGRFARLCSMCGKSSDEDWTLEERQYFSSRYLRFKKIFEEKGGSSTGITVGDAMLAYLTIFSYDQMDDKPDSAISVELDSLWPEFSSMNADPEEALVMDPVESDNQSLFKRFFTRTGSQTLMIAFIHARYLEDSGWVYSHELGKTHLEQCFGSKVSCKSYFVAEKDERGAAIEKAIEEGAHIIFTTSVQLLEASLKAAIAHPEVKILNCCVNHPHNLMRTYYGRMYEAKFLEGMIAGAMSANDRIAYVADYPIYGTLANINAFARGAAMTNPRSKIWLNWLCCPDQDLTKLLEEQDISIVADLDTVRPGALSRQFGLYEKKGDRIDNIAVPMWNWGKFYEKIVRDILFGSWNSSYAKSRPALNYWWGISGEIIDVIVSRNLPDGVNQLYENIRWQISSGLFHPFGGKVYRQDGTWAGDDDRVLTPEEIISMDWLGENVVGTIPTVSDVNEMAKELIALQGIAPARK